jgi:hypothetical protein
MGKIAAVKYREIIADNLTKAGWSHGCILSTDRETGSSNSEE